MKNAFAALVVLLLAGCSPPTAPATPAPASLSLWGMVIESSGACIAGGNVSVISGPGAGASQVQETPCSVWDYSGGFLLKGLSVRYSKSS